jgi:hypothetical protein
MGINEKLTYHRHNLGSCSHTKFLRCLDFYHFVNTEISSTSNTQDLLFVADEFVIRHEPLYLIG